MNNIYSRILEEARALEQDTVRFLCDLVRTPSFSTKEKDVIELIRREMQAAGLDEARIDGLGNVIGRVGNGPRLVAFDAHIDTVYPGDLKLWSFDPFTPKVEDGKVWGRGIRPLPSSATTRSGPMGPTVMSAGWPRDRATRAGNWPKRCSRPRPGRRRS